MSSIFMLPRQWAAQPTGVPYPGAKLYFYQTGTEVQQDVYQDIALQTPHEQPVEANDGGKFPVIYIDPSATSSLRIVLRSRNDSLIDDIPDVPVRELTSQQLWELTSPKITAETTAGATPTDYRYPIGNVLRYGAAPSAVASVNSAAIQSAVEVAYALGGGTVYIPAGTYEIDAPIIVYNTVSILGDGKEASVVKKATATASSVTDNSVRFWDSATVGAPVCCFHFVHKNGTGNWTDAYCRDVCAEGNTSSPNTTTTVYGFFFRGMSDCEVSRCLAEFVQVGFYWGAGATIVSKIEQNIAANVQRGFYQHFMTSTPFLGNYANQFRYAGYHISQYYSDVLSNAADNGGGAWKVGTTEIALAYHLNGCRGGQFSSNGTELHNGSVWKFTNCVSTRFTGNVALDVSSNYTGGSDVVLLENDSNSGCVYLDNRAQTDGVTGTGARHFIYKITSELGAYEWQRNRFVAVITDTTDTSTWTNTSGTIVESFSLLQVSGSFTPTIAGASVAGTTTYTAQEGKYERIGNVVNFRLRVSWSGQTGSGGIIVGALPYTSANTDDVPVDVIADSLTFTGQLCAQVLKNTDTCRIYVQATGAALTAVAIDTAATLWIRGSYLV